MKFVSLIVFIALSLLLYGYCYAGNYVLKNMNNTCAPWDGHAIAIEFENQMDSKKSIRIMLWNFPNKSFSLGGSNNQKYDGSVDICVSGGKVPSCQNVVGSIGFDNTISVLKDGQTIQGVLKVNGESIGFKTVIKMDMKEKMFCG